jgi:hypothetical protein
MDEPKADYDMASPDLASEVRRWNRHKIDIRLKVTAQLADGTTNSLFGRGNSMSHGGLGAYIPASIPVGSAIGLELTFPYSHNEVKVQAVVRSNEGFRYGLEFLELPREVQRVIVESCNAAEAGQ